MMNRKAVLLSVLLLLLFATAYGASAATEKVLYSFSGGNDGGVPFAGVSFDAQGNLVGTASSGGIVGGCGGLGCGVVYKMSPNGDGSWSQSVLHSFVESEGGNPYSVIALDARGNLYGTTLYYGAGCGTAFQLTPSQGGWRNSTLHYFQCGNDGGSSYGVQFDPTGHLFGTAYDAGANGDGLVFTLVHSTPASWTELALYAFNGGNDGNAPVGNLAFDRSGDIFGGTYVGGPNLSGTVFKLSRLGALLYVESVIYHFQGQAFGNGADGANPTAGVVMDSAGNLYGTTDYGGAQGVGVVFKLTRNSNGSYTESVLYTFHDGQDGGHPYGGVILDANGNLYGTTQGHNNSFGTVYKLTPVPQGQWTETILYRFQGGADGAVPYGGLTMDQAGHLYGTTAFGGHSGNGVAFEIVP